MTAYALIHGAGSDSWYWHLAAAELRRRGHEVVSPDLPCDDDAAGLAEYADVVVDAVGDRSGVVVVAQSLGGFTALLVCERVDAGLLVMLNAMVPYPGESPGEWWESTGWTGRPLETGQDFMEVFFHDVPEDVAAEGMKRGRPQSGTPFERPWPLDEWPRVPTVFLVGRGDRFFPARFQQRVLRERLDTAAEEIDGGHLIALSRPKELADRLERYAARRGDARVPEFTARRR
ncbi:MAG: alpha/beta hydrolase [Actinomycetota bacterium]|nr:alpha/beta hydrolase [Actinomycetota bacterium]